MKGKLSSQAFVYFDPWSGKISEIVRKSLSGHPVNVAKSNVFIYLLDKIDFDSKTHLSQTVIHITKVFKGIIVMRH